MVEQWIENPFVSGSIPLLDTIIMNSSKIKFAFIEILYVGIAIYANMSLLC